MSDDGFLSRWARRKEQARSGERVPPGLPAVALPASASEPVATTSPAPALAPAPTIPPELAETTTHSARADAPTAEPLPTFADVALLTRDSDYSRFVARGVDEGVKQAAMKKLFSDPHFNVMDGLDTYIDDYGKPDPIPLSMLKQMNQSKFLRLFEDDEDAAHEEHPEDDASAAAATAAAPTTNAHPPIASTEPLDDDPHLQLQPDDAARRPGPGQGPRA